MTASECLVEGGIPDGWTPYNLVWLVTAHRSLVEDKNTAAHGLARADWHRRWAAFCADLLETYRVYHH